MKTQTHPRAAKLLAAIAAIAGIVLPGTASALTVTNNKDNLPSAPLISGSLRWAIQNTPASGTVDFASSLCGQTVLLKAGQLVVDKRLTIKGLGVSKLTVSGNNASRVFFVTGSFATPSIISDMTITKGNAVGPDLTLNGNDSDGGGILNTGYLSLLRVSVSGNKAALGNGGGIYNRGTLSSVIDSTVAYNTAGQTGGGICDVQDMSIIQCAIINNTALGDGGGIQEAGTANLINTTVACNRAGGFGGGINDGSAGGGTIRIYNVTISGNTAASGGGLANAFPTGQSWELRNTIIANNLASPGPDVFIGGLVGSPISKGFNLIGNTSGSTPGPVASYQATDLLGTATLPLNPKLGPLQNNGGPTLTMALLPGSPAIDKGGNANLVSPAYPPTGYPFLPPIISDQRGFISRILNGGFSATVDIGAYEYAAAKDLKSEAIADTTPCLSSTDCSTVANARVAIRSIQCSLSSSLWKTNDKTRLGRCGELVFEYEEDAAYALGKIVKYSPDLACVKAANDALQDLVLADLQLALVAIDDALACNGNANSIANARAEIVKAQAAVAMMDYKQAIEYFEHAWEYAQDACRVSRDDDDCRRNRQQCDDDDRNRWGNDERCHGDDDDHDHD